MLDLRQVVKMQFCNTCYFTKHVSHAFKITIFHIIKTEEVARMWFIGKGVPAGRPRCTLTRK